MGPSHRLNSTERSSRSLCSARARPWLEDSSPHQRRATGTSHCRLHLPFSSPPVLPTRGKETDAFAALEYDQPTGTVFLILITVVPARFRDFIGLTNRLRGRTIDACSISALHQPRSGLHFPGTALLQLLRSTDNHFTSGLLNAAGDACAAGISGPWNL